MAEGRRCIAVNSMQHTTLGDAQAKLLHASGRTVAAVTEEQIERAGGTLYAQAHYEEHGRDEWFRQLTPPASAKDLSEAHRVWTEHKQRGRPPEVPWLEYTFTGASVIDWDMAQANEWCDKAFAEFRRVYPSANVLCATQHSAESAHHLHVFVEPWGRDAKGHLKKGKIAMLREGLAVLNGLPQQKRITVKAMQEVGRLWQDRCEDVLGVPYGFAPRQPGRVKGKRDPRLNDVERRAAHTRERARIVERKEREIAQEEEASLLRRQEAERAREAAEQAREEAVRANIDELTKQRVTTRLRKRLENRDLRKRNRVLEAEKAAWQPKVAAAEERAMVATKAVRDLKRENAGLREDLDVTRTLLEVARGNDPRRPKPKPRKREPTAEELHRERLARIDANRTIENSGKGLDEYVRELFDDDRDPWDRGR